jgi:nucleoside-diphosphate-sugar epimerase
MADVEAVMHTATLHKPHLGTHSRQDFVDTNIAGTLNLLEEAVAQGVSRFVLTSTTSVFGRAMNPAPGEPAAWITEDVVPAPKNIYGVTKKAAEDLAELIHLDTGLPCVVLRTSRFFLEADDRPEVAEGYEDANIKVNELLYRRVDLEDVVSAHLAALDRAAEVGFNRYIVSATSPFKPDDAGRLARNAPEVVREIFPDYERVYEARGWKMFSTLDRIYVNDRARADLGWRPVYDFRQALDRLDAGEDPRSGLAALVGAKGYHTESVHPYTVR